MRSLWVAALLGLTTANVAAQQNCAANASPSSTCYSGLNITSPNLILTVPSGVTVFAPYSDAVSNQTTNTSLFNNGGISSVADVGVYNASGSFALFNNSGTIFGNYIGLVNDGGTISSLLNSGTIISASQNFAGLRNENSGYISTLINSGNITGGYENRAGIYNEGGSTISTLINNGLITVGHHGGSGIDNTGGTITTLINNGTLASDGAYNGGLTNENFSTIISLVNYGTITAGSEATTTDFYGNIYGINRTIYNDAGSSIATLTNFGTLSSGGSFVQNNGLITTLNNMQGAGNMAGAVTYTGNLPTNYNIIIASPSVYGQLNANPGVTGTTHFGIYPGSVVLPGLYPNVLIGIAPNNLANTSGFYNLYNFTLSEVGSTNVYDLQISLSPTALTEQPQGLPSDQQLAFAAEQQAALAAEQQSVQALSDSQHNKLIEGRSTANELLGFTRPVEEGNHAFAGGMFGSAVGYAGGQASKRSVTVLGGIAYGSQDYGDAVTQDAATTVAIAARYTFDDFFGDKGNALRPFSEIGGWVTPDSGLKLNRAYNIGGASYLGNGSTDSTDWDYYLRLGVTTDLDHDNKLTGFGEIGEQAMDFGGYTEGAAINNPTPATVNAGELSMGVLRAGGAWTHKLGALPLGDSDNARAVPVAATVSGAVAHSFATHSGLVVSAGGTGFTAADTTDTWGEYGARIEGHVTQNATIGIDMLGTVGGGKLGNSTHAGVFLGYEF